VVIATDNTSSCKYNYHTITTTKAPIVTGWYLFYISCGFISMQESGALYMYVFVYKYVIYFELE